MFGLSKLFGFSTSTKDPVSPHSQLRIEFHKEARHFGEHGKLRVSHRKQNIDDKIVAFVFPDLTTPPHLDPSLVNYIWDQAAAKGYIVQCMVEYGRDREVVQFGSREAPLSEERAKAIAKSMHRIMGGEIEQIARSMKLAADQVSDFDGDELTYPLPIAGNRHPSLSSIGQNDHIPGYSPVQTARDAEDATLTARIGG